MEVVENFQDKARFFVPSNNQKNFRGNVKSSKKYIQPPQVKSCMPQTSYCPPKVPIDSKTTYYSSYYTENQINEARPKPFKPIHSINLPQDKFSNDTTTKLSFKPVWGVYKARPIFPHQRLCVQQGPMENITTIRKDYVPKYMTKPDPIIPSGHIRPSKGVLEATTTTLLSYMNPGSVERVANFKPQLKYCPPAEPSAKETTQKLSYLPYEVGKKENYPWAQKPIYKPPQTSMPGDTTYTKSYFENKAIKEKPILPRDTGVLPCRGKFFEKTVYRESFLPNQTDPVSPIIPCQNISLSNKKMLCDTTNKLSFQPIKGEKRKPIVPRPRKILGDAVFKENITTNQLEFTPKIMKRSEIIIPSGHIRTADQPLEDKTTTALSYVNPGPVTFIPNFKPVLKYCKPDKKLETDTVNKLSYPQWSIEPKEEFPWARRKQFEPSKDKMPSTTIYHMSFPPPGHYIDDSDEKSAEEDSHSAKK